MTYKLVVAAFAVAQIASVSACGWLDEKCCDVNPNNPNIGTCVEDRTICWEGQCMMCGVNGKPMCPSKPYCNEGTEENAQGWCSTIPGIPPPPPQAPEHCGWINEACCADNECLPERSACWEGTCMDCGVNGKPMCPSKPYCDEGNEVNAQGWCSTIPGVPPPNTPPPSTHCGWINEACCEGNECLADRSACWEGTCMDCGKDGKPQCPNRPHCDAGTKEKDGWCVHDNGRKSL